MELKTVKIADIVPYENNPRLNEDAVKAVAESIKQCGYCAPIIVDENMIILAGHTRRKALIRLGYENAEVCIISGLTEDQKRKYRLLDNKTNEFAEWDIELLASELEQLDFGSFDFGWDIEEEKPPKEQKEVEIKEDEFQIIIDCESEEDMETKFDFLTEQGYTCRISTL